MILAFISLRLSDLVDILLVAVLLYQLYQLVKGTAAFNIFLGIFSIYAIWQLVKFFQMKMLSSIIEQIISVGVIALVVIFQQEIRKFLFFLGSPKFLHKSRNAMLFFGWMQRLNKPDNITPESIDIIIASTLSLSSTKTGAILVITKKSDLAEIIRTGTIMDSNISQRLIENIFFKNSPLHDGAMIISDNKIRSVACVLPITNNPDFPKQLGLRHRASLGISEISDAFTIIVSEETGSISSCYEGKIHYNIPTAKLKKMLLHEFVEQE